MKELIDYVRLRHEENTQHFDDASETIELLYFEYVIPLWRSPRCSEEFRVVKDLIKLKRCLNNGEFQRTDFKSKLIKEQLHKYEIDDSLSDEKKLIANTQIFEQFRYFITAFFVIEVLYKEKRLDVLKFITTSLLALLTTGITFIAALLGLDWFKTWLGNFF